MDIAPLRRYNHPDLSDHVVHFTGRTGTPGLGVPPEISGMKDWERLGQILLDGRILAFPPFGTSAPVVCFTECTKIGIQTLMADGRYTPCGQAFTKDFALRNGAGPALYIRGDEWDCVDRMPAELRVRAVRFWPGATSTTGIPLPWYVAQESQWLHEREWRAPGAGTPPHFAFEWSDVAFVIAPDDRFGGFVAGYVGDVHPQYGAEFRRIPIVVVARDGKVIHDPRHVWL
jgi:hypothetical protein